MDNYGNVLWATSVSSAFFDFYTPFAKNFS